MSVEMANAIALNTSLETATALALTCQSFHRSILLSPRTMSSIIKQTYPQLHNEDENNNLKYTYQYTYHKMMFFYARQYLKEKDNEQKLVYKNIINHIASIEYNEFDYTTNDAYIFVKSEYQLIDSYHTNYKTLVEERERTDTFHKIIEAYGNTNIQIEKLNLALLDSLTQNHIELYNIPQFLLAFPEFDPNCSVETTPSLHGSPPKTTPLLHAIIKSYNQCGWLKTLLRYKELNPNIKDENGYTALHHTLNDQNSLKLLLTHSNINTNEVDNNGNTAVHHYVTNSSRLESLVILLEDPRTNPDLQNKQKITPLLMAIHHYFHSENIINWCNHDGSSSSHHGDADKIILEKIKLLLAHKKTNPNIVNPKYNYFPLLQAIQYKEWEIVSLLVNCPKIDFSVKDQQGKTILDFSLPENIQKLLPDDLQNKLTRKKLLETMYSITKKCIFPVALLLTFLYIYR